MRDLIKDLRRLHESRQETTTGNQPTIFGEAADRIVELLTQLTAANARADAAEMELKRLSNRLSYLVAVWHGSAQTADDCGDDIIVELKDMEQTHE